MDGQDTLEGLIVSYLLGELDESQQAYVLRQIRTDEQWKKAYDELRKMVLLVNFKHTAESVDLEKEWNSFEAARLVKEHPERFLNEAERFGNGIITEVSLKRRSTVSRLIAVSAIAASLLLATGWTVSYLFQQKKVTPSIARAQEKKVMPSFVTRSIVNSSGRVKECLLEDGSNVSLAPGSELEFREPFETDRRDIYLTGSATFEVARNKARPFTVYSAGISTTALGTRFTVTAFRGAQKIRVVLHEGKVVVKGIGDMKREVKKDFYLTAGQEFVFEKKVRMPAHVQNTNSTESFPTAMPAKDIARREPAADKPSIPNLGKSSWYMFNNQSLPRVFRQLESIYRTDIVYDKKELDKTYFIGTFNQGDSLETVLRQIALTNNLSVVKEHGKFIITIRE